MNTTMELDAIKIKIPEKPPKLLESYNTPWTIVNPWTKLCLKYGLIGEWKENGSSASRWFDNYTQAKSPKNGLPTLADFTMTILMHSRVNSNDCVQLAQWLSKNQGSLKKMQKVLLECSNLHAMNLDDITEIGAIIDEIIKEKDKGEVLKGIDLAKIFKWLSAWAPEHIPMINKYVHFALTDQKKVNPNKRIPCDILLKKFQFLLNNHYDELLKLGIALGKELKFKKSISPVRVLDNLIWFDWACKDKDTGAYRKDFKKNKVFKAKYPAYKATAYPLEVK